MRDITLKGKVLLKNSIDRDSYIHVCEYTGDVITYEEVMRREKKYLSDCDRKGIPYLYYPGKKL